MFISARNACIYVVCVMITTNQVFNVRLYSVLDTVVISGEDVCCSVVFGTLVGVFVFSVMWSELLMTSAISCNLWSLVYECHKVEWF